MPRFHIILGCLVIFASLSSRSFAAEKGHFDHISLPEKISIGPNDSYQASVKDDYIYFTKNIRLSSQIFKQSLIDGKYQPLLDGKSDAKSPSPQPGGDTVLFTYFKYDAKGDICLLKETSVYCITSSKTEDRSPVWLDNDNLLYLRRKASNEPWSLVSYNLTSKKKKWILTGDIASLSASHDGSYLAFNQLDNNKKTLILYDLKTKKSLPIKLSLPGLTGLSSFSPDGQFIYFSHYLNDTNADNMIDGNDHSVIFRLPVKDILKSPQKVHLPEQMTSVEQNCNFPNVAQDFVYLTCAYQGTLDLYRIPLTGVVPDHWNQAELEEAHQVARTAEERLLILNKLRYQFPKTNNPHTLERVLFHHLQTNEMTAARFYVNELIAKKHYPDFFQILKVYIDVREAKNREKSNLLSESFKKTILKKSRELSKASKWKSLKKIVQAYIYETANLVSKAKKTILSISQRKAKLLPLERYLSLDLYLKLFDPRKDLETFTQLYLGSINANDIQQESKVYLTFTFLSQLEQNKISNKAKIDKILNFKSNIKTESLNDLLDSEVLNYKMLASKDKDHQKETFAKLKKIYNKTKNHYFLRKAIYIRSLHIFSKAGLDYFLERVASYWLRYTKLSQAEFIYAADQFNYVTLEKAYQNYHHNKLDLSSSSFFISVNQTNNLEAHYGYLAVVLKNQKNFTKYQKAYEILEKNKKLQTAKPIVDAMLATEKTLPNSKDPSSELDRLIASLELDAPNPFNESLRYLLLGFCYHEKFRLSLDIYDYDSSAFEKAHRNYILAEYLAQDNQRILASVWENLGVLHQEAQNHSISVGYFSKREPLGFEDGADELAFRLMYAKSLFNSHQAKDAYQQIKIATRHKTKNPKQSMILRERRAFYALYSGDYTAAVKEYDSLLKEKKLPVVNQVRFYLASGFAKKKLSRYESAKQDLKQVLKLSSQVAVKEPQGQRLIGQFPQRFRIIALGLLAQISDAKDQIRYRNQRIEDLVSLKEHVDQFRMKEADRLSYIVLAYQQNVATYLQQGKMTESFKTMDLAWNYARQWYENGGSVYGKPLYASFSNGLLLALKYRGQYEVKDSEFEKIIEISKQEFSELKNKSDFQVYKQKKMEMLWLAYKNRLSKDSLKKALAEFFNTPEMDIIKDKLPKKFAELHSLADNFRSTK